MLSQKWPPDHQHPIGRLGTQTLRWGGGGTCWYPHLQPPIHPPGALLQSVGNSAVGTGTTRTQSTLSPPLPCPLHLPWSSSLLSSASNAASQRIRDTLATTSKGVRSPLCFMTQLSRAGTGRVIPPQLPVSTASLARHGGDVTSTVKTFVIG